MARIFGYLKGDRPEALRFDAADEGTLAAYFKAEFAKPDLAITTPLMDAVLQSIGYLSLKGAVDAARRLGTLLTDSLPTISADGTDQGAATEAARAKIARAVAGQTTQAGLSAPSGGASIRRPR